MCCDRATQLYLDAFDEVSIPEPDNLFDDYADRGTAAREQDTTIGESLELKADLKVWTEKGRQGPRWDGLYGRMDAVQLDAFEASYTAEMKNPAGDAAYAEVVSELRTRSKHFRMSRWAQWRSADARFRPH